MPIHRHPLPNWRSCRRQPDPHKRSDEGKIRWLAMTCRVRLRLVTRCSHLQVCASARCASARLTSGQLSVRYSVLTGCCPNAFSLWPKRFLINLRLAPGDVARSGAVQAARCNLCAILALRAQTVDIAGLPPRQDLLAKNVLMPAQRNYCLGNSPLISYFLIFR